MGHTMKILTTAVVALFAGASSISAFVPSASRPFVESRSCSSSLSMNKSPFFATEAEKKGEESPVMPEASLTAAAVTTANPSGDVDAVTADAIKDAAKTASENAALDKLTAEEEIEMMVQRELSKSKKASKLKNAAAGVEYAPWMNISEDDEEKIRVVMREKTEARRRRQEQARDVSGNLFRDSQAQELSGTGLSYKIIDGEVELTWATKRERNTKEDTYGGSADVCQALIEVETEDEQRGALVAAAGFGVFAIAAFLAGVAFDPMNGY